MNCNFLRHLIMKININKKCMLRTDVSAFGKTYKEGEVVFVVDAFTEEEGVFIAIKGKGDDKFGVWECGFRSEKINAKEIKNINDLSDIVTLIAIPCFDLKKIVVLDGEGKEVCYIRSKQPYSLGKNKFKIKGRTVFAKNKKEAISIERNWEDKFQKI